MADKPKKKEVDDTSLIPSRVIVSGFMVVIGLLVVAVVVGLLRDQVNVDGLIIALMPVITGVIVGSAIRTKPGKDEDK